MFRPLGSPSQMAITSGEFQGEYLDEQMTHHYFLLKNEGGGGKFALIIINLKTLFIAWVFDKIQLKQMFKTPFLVCFWNLIGFHTIFLFTVYVQSLLIVK